MARSPRASASSGIPAAAAEAIIVERDLRLVELTGARYHAAGLSTASAVAAIRAAKNKGLRVTCAVAPHHFALNELGVGDYRTFAKIVAAAAQRGRPPGDGRGPSRTARST